MALLAVLPLRIRAFGSLVLGEHVKNEGDGWRVSVSADLSKSRRPWDGAVPAALTPGFERYLDEIRPALLALTGRWHRDPGQALWISVDGSPMRPKALAEAISKRTSAAFGRTISPHFFRDCAATTLALDNPANVRLATALLGHSNPQTTTAHYNQANSVDAGRRHIEALRALRQAGRRNRRSARRAE